MFQKSLFNLSLLILFSSGGVYAEQIFNDRAMHLYEAMTPEETKIVYEGPSIEAKTYAEEYKTEIDRMDYSKAKTVVYGVTERQDENHVCQKISIWSGYESRDWQMNSSKTSETYICDELP